MTMRRTLSLAALLLLSGCYGDYVENYGDRFPITVAREAPVLLLGFPAGSARLAGEDAARLDAFLAGFADRPNGTLRVTAQRGTDVDRLAVERLVEVERRAIALGVPKAFIELGLADGRTPVANVVVAYERYVAQIPECGDWSKDVTWDRTNTPSSNFGCATQRYVGQMAADPKDLVEARGYGPHDPERTSDVLRRFKTGTNSITDPTIRPPQVIGGGGGASVGSGGQSK
jgi:pilus assembly protein CpaD